MSLPSGKPRALIVDDEEVIADTLAMILNRDGFEARAVYTCREAVALAPEFQPGILISDVLMSDINGIDAAIQIRAQVPEVQVFLLSGQSVAAELLSQSQAPSLGFEVLVKPVHPRDLLSKLHAAIAAAPEQVA